VHEESVEIVTHLHARVTVVAISRQLHNPKRELIPELSPPVQNHSRQRAAVKVRGTNVCLSLVPYRALDRSVDERRDHAVVEGRGVVVGRRVAVGDDVVGAICERRGGHPRFDVRASPVGSNKTNGNVVIDEHVQPRVVPKVPARRRKLPIKVVVRRTDNALPARRRPRLLHVLHVKYRLVVLRVFVHPEHPNVIPRMIRLTRPRLIIKARANTQLHVALATAQIHIAYHHVL